MDADGNRGSPPRWLQRIEASGCAFAAAKGAAAEAHIVIQACTEPTSSWVAQCLSIERRVFPPHEAMDIADQVRACGVTLLCATPMTEWSGPDIGRSVGPDSCVGYVVVQRSELLGASDALIAKLAVAPALRRRGIARALLAAALSHAQSSRAATCSLHVDVTNAPALALYASMGFTPHGEVLRDFYRAGRHGQQMIRPLVLGRPGPEAEAEVELPRKKRSLIESAAGAPPPSDPDLLPVLAGTEVEELD